jgi:BMFP domain-containing protein YqiC
LVTDEISHDFSKLENITKVLEADIEVLNSSLQHHISTTLTNIQRQVNSQLQDFANETRRNVEILQTRFEALEANIRSMLNLVNSSLQQDIQDLFEGQLAIRLETQDLVNRSAGEVFEHIESEIMQARKLISTEISGVRHHIDTEVADTKVSINSSLHQEIQLLSENTQNLVNRSFSEIFEHIENEVTEVNIDISDV